MTFVLDGFELSQVQSILKNYTPKFNFFWMNYFYFTFFFFFTFGTRLLCTHDGEKTCNKDHFLDRLL